MALQIRWSRHIGVGPGQTLKSHRNDENTNRQPSLGRYHTDQE